MRRIIEGIEYIDDEVFDHEIVDANCRVFLRCTFRECEVIGAVSGVRAFRECCFEKRRVVQFEVDETAEGLKNHEPRLGESPAETDTPYPE